MKKKLVFMVMGTHPETGIFKDKKPLKNMHSQCAHHHTEVLLPIITSDMLANSKKKARDCDCPECLKKPEQPLFYTQQNAERSKK